MNKKSEAIMKTFNSLPLERRKEIILGEDKILPEFCLHCIEKDYCSRRDRDKCNGEEKHDTI